jgi:chloramphenicol 3-O phosphotransferase
MARSILSWGQTISASTSSPRQARVILLNGVGSAGKSAVAKALQAITSESFLHVQMDSFLEMLPEACQNHPDSFAYETVHESGKPLVVINTGPLGERLLRGMRRAIAALAAEGNNLIVDDVLLDDANADYAALLAPFEVFRVGVFAPLDMLEARERERGDRMTGLARWQYDRVHQGMTYDLEVDTCRATPMECAERIKQAFGL